MSVSKEDYLKTIYQLSKKDVVNNKKISEVLNISAASVSEMTKKLEELKYISYNNKKIELLDEGKKIAISTMRKHRVWELFLYDVLGFELSKVHKEAEKLEHVTSDELLLKLEKFLFFSNEYNEKDIDIDPIKYENSISNLINCNIGDKVVILNYSKRNDELRKYLLSKNIDLKHEYIIVDKNEYDSSITLKAKDNNILTIGKMAAEFIEVYKI